jgi:methionyl aminopeptidase
MNYVKTESQLNIMRRGGKLLASILQDLKTASVPGTNIWDLEERFIHFCKENNVRPACKGYAPYTLPPYPAGLCVSVNSQSVHCTPSKDYSLKDEDIITIDTVIEIEGMHVDAAICKAMPGANTTRKTLARTAELAFFDSVSKVKDGVRTGAIANKIYKTASRFGYDVLRDYAGHGIGTSMHEWPEIPCYGNKNDGVKLKEGMTICIETLICSGKPHVKTYHGRWDTVMADGKDFCQYEHTVLVKKDGYEIITQP